MTEREFFQILLIGFAAIGAAIFIVLFFVSAPYGRHTRSGWGPRLNNRWGWFLMEAPSALLFLVYFLVGQRKDVVPILLLLIWQSHYVHRAFVYPFTLPKKRNMPVSVVLFALVFNLVNSYIQARWIYSLAPMTAYTKEWLTDIRFLLGICIFYSGFLINKRADQILRNLRKPGDTDYKIPDKGLFRYVSCPNYLGEIIEWMGWAVAVWSVPGFVFALWTVFNLLPRARSHHFWYKRTFRSYPDHRKALIPYVL
jgi:3-oxo-5-alpha-steroid 4-dehydrogenase 1